MANYYVRSGAGGGGTGADWANAFTKLSTAFAAGGAGDTFWLADDHSESEGAAITLTSPGTAAAPCRVLCTADHSTEPPTTLATSAAIATGANAALNIDGYCYYYGITFSAGSGGSESAAWIYPHFNQSPGWLFFDNCVLFTNSTHSNARLIIGRELGNAQNDQTTHMEGTSVRFSSTGSEVELNSGRLVWRDSTALHASSSTPTQLFASYTAGVGPDVECRNIDFNSLGSNTLITVNDIFLEFRCFNCKLPSGVTVASGFTGPSQVVKLVNCDSADTNYRYHKQNYMGTIVSDTAIKLDSGGFSDGTTSYSRKMTASPNTQEFLTPLVSDPIEYWNETTGSSVSVSVPVVTDGVTLQDDEAWVEVEYLGTSGFPLALTASDRMSDIMATPANQTTDSDVWTTTGLSSPVYQKLVVSFTPQEKGLFFIRVHLAKPSTTMYFDKPTIS